MKLKDVTRNFCSAKPGYVLESSAARGRRTKRMTEKGGGAKGMEGRMGVGEQYGWFIKNVVECRKSFADLEMCGEILPRHPWITTARLPSETARRALIGTR